ncbi:hypothetical protein [Sphingobacterium multivorum]|uniref:hypothetical protein n=1 Tax=Sphingobacterium multivorum TaxID=28454 RepID=UPI0028A95506|nr:hypothetical protein [Sphingobacterium multivorum]
MRPAPGGAVDTFIAYFIIPYAQTTDQVLIAFAFKGFQKVVPDIFYGRLYFTFVCWPAGSAGNTRTMIITEKFRILCL